MLLWLKVVHLVAMVAWMAGLFYLPRLFVYHTRVEIGSTTDKLFSHMEDRLLKVIMRPAGIVTVIAGLGLAQIGGFSFFDYWLIAKLVGVIGLVAYQFWLEHFAVLFASGWRGRPEKFFRLLNELPTVLLIWIVIWVVIKPFS